MSLDVYFRDDLARMLRSVCVVASATISDPAEARGFALAVRAMGEAIGVSSMPSLELSGARPRKREEPLIASPNPEGRASTHYVP